MKYVSSKSLFRFEQGTVDAEFAAAKAKGVSAFRFHRSAGLDNIRP